MDSHVQNLYCMYMYSTGCTLPWNIRNMTCMDSDDLQYIHVQDTHIHVPRTHEEDFCLGGVLGVSNNFW